ncbi:MAG: aldo/keto reductase [Thermoplasmata archaeon]|jgi:diketogulonate reductase-like aldo/keto reductase|nr:aldo/keto reductase [Thermoplasmata archaeon]
MPPAPDPIGSTRVRLNQGNSIPLLGLGVYQSRPGAETQQAVAWALELGYRHIDTAALYENEADVGAAIRASGIPREDLFVTTKLWQTEHGFEKSQRAAQASLRRLGLSYVDLYLIHSPRANSPEDRRASWRGLEKLHRDGLCRAIGVSNYGIRHLEELNGEADVVPAVNQVEFHPFVFDPELVAYCDRRGIRIEAWAPLTRGRRFEDATVRAVASAHHRTPAQVLLRWGIEHGFVEIPKSVHRERIAENAAIFDFSLSEDEVRKLDALSDGGRVSGWNPSVVP